MVDPCWRFGWDLFKKFNYKKVALKTLKQTKHLTVNLPLFAGSCMRHDMTLPTVEETLLKFLGPGSWR